ncbi:hypothetical protein MRB53_040445 [Persea americana]|nr:hypothetical protein MRB53_040445 [Persea americana]
MVPWYSMIIGISIALSGHLIGFASQYSLGGVIPQVFFMDVGQSCSQISNQARIFQLDPTARSRINANYIIFLFLGQTMGSAVGTRLYTRHGWWASQGFAVGCVAGALLLSLVRGPWQTEDSWCGYSGGISMRLKKDSVESSTISVPTEKQPDVENDGS